ncbi:MAG: hypothetical protein R3B53_01790 [Candidatus Paceibacterota bacterium]
MNVGKVMFWGFIGWWLIPGVMIVQSIEDYVFYGNETIEERKTRHNFEKL